MKEHHETLLDFFDAVFSTTSEKTSAVVAAGMISSPFWTAYIKDISELAALLGPILGVIYLSIQIVYKLIQFGHRDEE